MVGVSERAVAGMPLDEFGFDGGRTLMVTFV